MELSEPQQNILAALRGAVGSSKDAEFVYCSEWLGYLPYGAYHGVEIDGVDITGGFPRDWRRSDLSALEQAGLLRVLSQWQDPDDEYHQKVVYILT